MYKYMYLLSELCEVHYFSVENPSLLTTCGSYSIDYIDYVTGIKNESREPFSLIHFLRAILVAKNSRYGK